MTIISTNMKFGETSFINNPDNFWIRLEENKLEYNAMITKLQTDYRHEKDNNNSIVKASISHGSIYCVFNERLHEWNRCQLKQLSADQDTALIFYNDIGSTELVKTKCLKQLNDSYKSIKSFAFCCSLDNVKPSTVINRSNCIFWSTDAIFEFNNLLNGKSISVCFKDFPSSNENNKVDLFVSKENIAEKLIQSGKGAASSSSSNNNRQSNILKTPFLMNTTTLKEMSIDCDYKTEDDVLVSHINSPYHFYIQMNDKLKEFKKFEEEMQTYYSSHLNEMQELRNPQVGELCISLYSEDKEWYRALIVDNQCFGQQGEQYVRVFFIDYGNEDLVPVQQERSLFTIANQFANYPCMALRCSLAAHIERTSNDSSSFARLNEIVDFIYECVGDQVKVVFCQKTTFNSYSVEVKVTKTEPKCSDLAQLLIDGGYAQRKTTVQNTNNKSGDSTAVQPQQSRAISNAGDSVDFAIGATRHFANEINKQIQEPSQQKPIFKKFQNTSETEQMQNIVDDCTFKDTFTFCITHVETIYEFYVQMCSRRSKMNDSADEHPNNKCQKTLSQLMQDIQVYYKRKTNLPQPLFKEGNVCIFYDTEQAAILANAESIPDENPESSFVFYRAVIFSIVDSTHCVIRLVDYGHTKYVNIFHLRDINDRFLTPKPFALLATMDTLTEMSQTQQIDEKVNVKFREIALRRQFTGKISRIEECSKDNTASVGLAFNKKYYLNLFDCTDSSVFALLIEEVNSSFCLKQPLQKVTNFQPMVTSQLNDTVADRSVYKSRTPQQPPVSIDSPFPHHENNNEEFSDLKTEVVKRNQINATQINAMWKEKEFVTLEVNLSEVQGLHYFYFHLVDNENQNSLKELEKQLAQCSPQQQLHFKSRLNSGQYYLLRLSNNKWHRCQLLNINLNKKNERCLKFHLIDSGALILFKLSPKNTNYEELCQYFTSNEQHLELFSLPNNSIMNQGAYTFHCRLHNAQNIEKNWNDNEKQQFYDQFNNKKVTLKIKLLSQQEPYVFEFVSSNYPFNEIANRNKEQLILPETQIMPLTTANLKFHLAGSFLLLNGNNTRSKQQLKLFTTNVSSFSSNGTLYLHTDDLVNQIKKQNEFLNKIYSAKSCSCKVSQLKSDQLVLFKWPEKMQSAQQIRQHYKNLIVNQWSRVRVTSIDLMSKSATLKRSDSSQKMMIDNSLAVSNIEEEEYYYLELFFLDYGFNETVRIGKSQNDESDMFIMDIVPECLLWPCCVYECILQSSEQMNILSKAKTQNEFIDAQFLNSILFQMSEKLCQRQFSMEFIQEESFPFLIQLYDLESGSTLSEMVQSYALMVINSQLFQCVLSHVNTHADFYIQKCDRQSEKLIEQLAVNIETLIGQKKTQPLIEFTNGSLCLAMYSEDGAYYRARVLSAENQILKVLFIDYGNMDQVPLADCMQMPEQLRLTYPYAMAIHCQVNGEGVNATELDKYFMELIEFKFYAKCVRRVSDKNGSDLFISSSYLIELNDMVTNADIMSMFKRHVEKNQNKMIPVPPVKVVSVDDTKIEDNDLSELDDDDTKAISESQMNDNTNEGLDYTDSIFNKNDSIRLPQPQQKNNADFEQVNSGIDQSVNNNNISVAASEWNTTPMEIKNFNPVRDNTMDQTTDQTNYEENTINESIDDNNQDYHEDTLHKDELYSTCFEETSPSKTLIEEKDEEYVQLTNCEISKFDSIESFYIQQENFKEEIEKLQPQIDECLEAFDLSLSRLCVAQSVLDNLFHRSKVLKWNEDKWEAEVLFIDYGRIEWVSIHTVTELTESLKKVKPLAIHCSLLTELAVNSNTCKRFSATHEGEQKSKLQDLYAQTISSPDFTKRFQSNGKFDFEINPSALDAFYAQTDSVQCPVCPTMYLFPKNKQSNNIINVNKPTKIENAEIKEKKTDLNFEGLCLSSDSIKDKEEDSATTLLEDCIVTHIEKVEDLSQPDSLFLQQSNAKSQLAIKQHEIDDCIDGFVLSEQRVCVAENPVDHCFYRGRVLQWPEIEDENSKALVFFIDYGYTHLVQIDMITRISDKLRDLEPMALNCILPNDNRIIVELNGLYDVKVNTRDLNRLKDEMNNSETLKHLAEKPKPIQMLQLIEKETEDRLKKSKRWSSKSTLITDDNAVSINDQTQQFKICSIVMYNSSKSFYIQQENFKEEIEKLQPQIDECLEAFDLSLSRLCVAQSVLDNLFHRSKVLKWNEDKWEAEVLFIDYGRIEWISIHTVTELTEPLKKVKPLAIHCSLLTELSNEAEERFSNLINEKEFRVHVKMDKIHLNRYYTQMQDNKVESEAESCQVELFNSITGSVLNEKTLLLLDLVTDVTKMKKRRDEDEDDDKDSAFQGNKRDYSKEKTNGYSSSTNNKTTEAMNKQENNKTSTNGHQMKQHNDVEADDEDDDDEMQKVIADIDQSNEEHIVCADPGLYLYSGIYLYCQDQNMNKLIDAVDDFSHSLVNSTVNTTTKKEQEEDNKRTLKDKMNSYNAADDSVICLDDYPPNKTVEKFPDKSAEWSFKQPNDTNTTMSTTKDNIYVNETIGDAPDENTWIADSKINNETAQIADEDKNKTLPDGRFPDQSSVWHEDDRKKKNDALNNETVYSCLSFNEQKSIINESNTILNNTSTMSKDTTKIKNVTICGFPDENSWHEHDSSKINETTRIADEDKNKTLPDGRFPDQSSVWHEDDRKKKNNETDYSIPSKADLSTANMSYQPCKTIDPNKSEGSIWESNSDYSSFDFSESPSKRLKQKERRQQQEKVEINNKQKAPEDWLNGKDALLLVINSLEDIYAQTENADESLRQMKHKLEECCQDPTKKVNDLKELAVGQLYCYLSNDQNDHNDLYRVQCIDNPVSLLTAKAVPPAHQKVKVHFIDYGYNKYVDVLALYKLSSDLIKQNPLAVHCALYLSKQLEEWIANNEQLNKQMSSSNDDIKQLLVKMFQRLMAKWPHVHLEFVYEMPHLDIISNIHKIKTMADIYLVNIKNNKKQVNICQCLLNELKRRQLNNSEMSGRVHGFKIQRNKIQVKFQYDIFRETKLELELTESNAINNDMNASRVILDEEFDALNETQPNLIYMARVPEHLKEEFGLDTTMYPVKIEKNTNKSDNSENKRYLVKFTSLNVDVVHSVDQIFVNDNNVLDDLLNNCQVKEEHYELKLHNTDNTGTQLAQLNKFKLSHLHQIFCLLLNFCGEDEIDDKEKQSLSAVGMSSKLMARIHLHQYVVCNPFSNRDGEDEEKCIGFIRIYDKQREMLDINLLMEKCINLMGQDNGCFKGTVSHLEMDFSKFECTSDLYSAAFNNEIQKLTKSALRVSSSYMPCTEIDEQLLSKSLIGNNEQHICLCLVNDVIETTQLSSSNKTNSMMNDTTMMDGNQSILKQQEQFTCCDETTDVEVGDFSENRYVFRAVVVDNQYKKKCIVLNVDTGKRVAVPKRRLNFFKPIEPDFFHQQDNEHEYEHYTQLSSTILLQIMPFMVIRVSQLRDPKTGAYIGNGHVDETLKKLIHNARYYMETLQLKITGPWSTENGKINKIIYNPLKLTRYMGYKLPLSTLILN